MASRVRVSQESQSATVTVGETSGVIRTVPNATVTVYTNRTSTLLPVTMYAGPTGGTTVSNPLTAGSDGAFEFWLEPGDRRLVRLVVNGSGAGLGSATYDDVAPAMDPANLVTLDGSETLTNKTIEDANLTGTPTGNILPSDGGSATNLEVTGGTITNVYQMGPNIWDHLAFDGANDAAKINAALDYFRSSQPLGATLMLNKNQIHLDAGIDASHLNNFILRAPGGPGGCFLYGSNLPSGHPIVDTTGSRSWEIHNVVFAGQEGDGTDPGTAGNRPPVGILIAASGTETSNRGHLIGCGSVGYFGSAAVYAYGSSNLTLRDCAFQTDSNIPTVVLTLDNVSSVSSPYQTIATGTSNSASDISLRDVEIHRNDTSNAGTALVIRGVKRVTMDGGLLDAYVAGSNHVSLTSVSGNKCSSIAFKNLRAYKDQAGTVAGTMAYVTDTVDGLSIQDCEILSGISNLVAGPSGMVVNGLTILGDVTAYGFSGTLVSATSGSGGTINGGLIQAGGLQINVGSGSVTAGTVVIDSGGITAGTNNAVETINNVLRTPGGSTSVPGLSTSADPNTGIELPGSDVGALVAGAAQILKWAAGGVSLKRLLSSGFGSAPTLATAVASSGWGTGASASISGTELAFDISVTAGSGASANPTIALSWPGSAYSTAPKCSVFYSGAPNTTMPMFSTITPSTTGLTIATYGQVFNSGTNEHSGGNWTPTNTQVYKFTVLVAGGA